MSSDKIITISIKELSHMKIILSAWYSFLKENFDDKKISGDDFTDLLKTPVMYDLDKDQIELMICGTESLLEEFRSKVF